jgi:gluconolactonase
VPRSPSPTAILAGLLVSVGFLGLPPAAKAEDPNIPLTADSKPQPGVPQGELIRFDFSTSSVFPGTTRQVTVYVPRQYDPAHPACVYVGQDGVQWKAPTVLDNLIARHEVPVIIGVFVTPGVVPSADPKGALSRYNRSFEYDGLGDGYYHLIVDEILPAVELRKTTDGRAIHLSNLGNDRAIGGGSSGGIAAFNVAWEHPEAFSRVISSVGTYIGLRGADRFPTLIRKYEPKPIRVFLQDGSHDLNIYAGDWWMANQTMERALQFGGYEVNHSWGEGSHNGKHISAVLPDAMRWVWKDWPAAVAAGHSENGALKALLIAGEGWKQENVSGYHNHERPYGPIAVTVHNGNSYRAVAGNENAIWLTSPSGTKAVVDRNGQPITALTASPDQTLLYAAEGHSHWIESYQIRADGTLSFKQRYYWLHVDDLDDESDATSMCCDGSGWLYVATSLGVQVCDQAGRVNAILPTPTGRPLSLSFDGPQHDTLVADCGDAVYSRKLHTVGVDPAAAPVLPPAPHL